MQSAKMTLHKANTNFASFEDMYDMVTKDDYLLNLVTKDDVERIRVSLKSGKPVDLVQYSIVTNFLSVTFNRNRKDYGELLHCFPDNFFVYHFYQMNSNKWMRGIKFFTYDAIGTNTKINIPLNLFDYHFVPNTKYPFSWQLLDPKFKEVKFNFSDLLVANAFGNPTLDQFQVRVMSSEKMNLQQLLKNPASVTDSVRRQFKRVVMHMHGGGFITMNSSAQQQYLRKFANEGECVLISVDYPLAPLKTYKEILRSIFTAYLFITVV